MIQCKDCEFYETGEKGQRVFKCDPFVNIKEAECLSKWQLLRLDMLVANYRSMFEMQQKMAPVQDRILKYVQRELDDIDETDKWKLDDDDDDDEDEEFGSLS